jgi:hypothetical protein
MPLPMNVLLLRWDIKPDKRISEDVPTPLNDTQNIYLCRCGLGRTGADLHPPLSRLPTQ